ncbi:hypothetical protein AALC75_04915 [Lachnospiraceae bacterium 48-42]
MLRKFNKDTLENKAAWWNPEVPEGPGKEPKKGKKEKQHKNCVFYSVFKVR